MLILIFVISAIYILNYQNLHSKENLYFYEYNAKSGDNTTTVFEKFKIEQNDINLKKFYELNPKKFTKKKGLKIGFKYFLPIVQLEILTEDNEIISYKKFLEKYGYLYKRKKSFYYIPYDEYLKKRKSIKSDNETLGKAKSKKRSEDNDQEEIKEEKQEKESNKSINEKLFGKDYSKVKILDNKLRGRVFYLDPGHGGPDPGAIAEFNGHKISEDEYAYDITLRLGYFLLQHSAKVHFLIHDHSDGIRDELYLKLDNDEVNNDGTKISLNQKNRLEQRIRNINELRKNNKKLKPKSEDLLTIHLDSRDNDQRIDIFFYYQEDSEESKNFANTLYNTIEAKYEKYQPGRGYKGNVSTRDLYMLKNSPINAVFMELGNIKNSSDQKRFIQKNNRQAIANWLCDGILDYYSKTTPKNTKK